MQTVGRLRDGRQVNPVREPRDRFGEAELVTLAMLIWHVFGAGFCGHCARAGLGRSTGTMAGAASRRGGDGVGSWTEPGLEV